MEPAPETIDEALCVSETPESQAVPRVPVIDGDWRRLCEMPDLGDLEGPRGKSGQNVVDHGLIRARDGQWRLWACIRGTGVGRLLYGWRGRDLEKGPWEPVGVMARARAECGEGVRDGAEAIGAPFFIRIDGVYYCFYHSRGLHWMRSEDGAHYERILNDDGSSLVYPHAGRDVMVLPHRGRYFVYSCVSVAEGGYRRSFVQLVTTRDFREWSDYTVVNEGGVGGDGPVAAESPFVVEVDGFFYLFRASSISFHTYVYRSRTPCHFGVHDDSKLIAVLPIKAPELLCENGQWRITDLADFQGVKIAPLRWDRA